MKIVSILFCLAIFSSCIKEPVQPQSTSSASCLVNGAYWNSSQQTINRSNGTIELIAWIPDAEIISIRVKDESEGQYTLEGSDNFGQILPPNSSAYVSDNFDGTGTLNITQITPYSVNAEMSGTFNFTAYNSQGQLIEVTNGEFKNIKF